VAQQRQRRRLGLDAFGDKLQIERVCERDDRPHDREIARIGTQFTDEPLVDLESVDRQRLQV
jgi:hypothetical protein